jgi:ABC-type Fe3+ transport system substrate-binding protein
MKRLATLIALAILVSLRPAFAQQASAQQASAQIPTELNALIAAAQQEGTLNLAWSESLLGGGDAAQKYATAFNAYFHTKIAFTYAPAVEVARLANQLYTEQQANQPASTDMFAGSAPQVQPLVKRNALLPIPWSTLLPAIVTPDMVEANGDALRVQTALSGVSYNTDAVKTPPTSLQDFLKPEWKGKIATTPYAAGFDVLAAKDLWGPDKLIDYMTKFSRQVAGLIRCGDVERLATGEFAALVMDCSGNLTLRWQDNGAPVAYAIADDAAQRRFTYVTVPRNSRHPAAATLFGLFLDTQPAQALMWDSIRIDLDTLKGSHLGPNVAAAQARGVKFTDVTIGWWDSHPEVDETKSRIIKILTSK